MNSPRAVYHLSLGIVQGQLVFLVIAAMWIYQGPGYWNTGKIEDKLFLIIPTSLLIMMFLIAFRGYEKVTVTSKYIVISHVFPIFVRKRVMLTIPIKECRSIVVSYSRRSHRFNKVYFHPLDKSKDVPYHSGTDAGLAKFLAKSLHDLGYKVNLVPTESDTSVELRLNHE
jgi:hypothetical protein